MLSSAWFEGTEGGLDKSPSFKEKDINMVLRSDSFKEGRVVFEHSLSFKNWEPKENKLEITTSFTIQSLDANWLASFSLHSEEGDAATTTPKALHELFSPRPKSELDAAAVKLQKAYKGYRTRRNLADCAVVIEELWWKALDFASLKQSSVSFFNVEKTETAISRWARARTRAAKVGKGLSKNAKAQKLALQHWLEAIDPRHRYGHNLHLYYDVWFNSESTQPFFYWLDIGDGKEVNLEKCSRNKLQHQCIKYLGPKERGAYEVVAESGKLVYKQSRLFVDTVEGSKWIFVLSTSRNLYVGQKRKGEFQHSSFLSGAATNTAGRLVAKKGVLEAIWPYSGHYHPTEDNFREFISFLTENNVDLTSVKRGSVDDDEYPSFRKLDKKATEEVAEVADVVEKPFDFSNGLPCNWNSGIGPRISCVRDYPVDLQSKALEQVNLSPRVTSTLTAIKTPIPSPRPSPGVLLSPRLANIGIPSPRVSLRLPESKKKMIQQN